MARPIVLVTGTNGQLGSELQALHTGEPELEWIFTTRGEMDLSDTASIDAVLDQYHPDWIINCAAYTAVDKAESERELALAINAQAPATMAAYCAAHGAHLVHISTDYVFHGDGTHPYKPEDTTDPVNFYGQTKLEGELLLMAAAPESIVIRTSWVYSTFGKNFVKTMRHLMQTRDKLNVVADQKGTPTYAKDLAAAIIQIIKSPSQYWGIYHFSNAGEITWYDFAVAIRDLSQLECKVNPIPTSAFPTPAKRPAYSVLDKSKLEKNYPIVLKDWRESLKDCIQLLSAV